MSLTYAEAAALVAPNVAPVKVASSGYQDADDYLVPLVRSAPVWDEPAWLVNKTTHHVHAEPYHEQASRIAHMEAAQ